MDYTTEITKEGVIILTINLCKDHGTITGKINIAIDEPATAQSIGEELIQRAFEAHEQSQKDRATHSKNKVGTTMNLRKIIRESFIDIKVHITNQDYKKARNLANTMIAFIDDNWKDDG